MESSAQAKAFINEIAYIIQEEAKARGYKVCSPIIAQACIESAFGTSSLGYRWHNYFGMKCGSSWKGKSVNLSTKEEYVPGQHIKGSLRDENYKRTREVSRNQKTIGMVTMLLLFAVVYLIYKYFPVLVESLTK